MIAIPGGLRLAKKGGEKNGNTGKERENKGGVSSNKPTFPSALDLGQRQ